MRFALLLFVATFFGFSISTGSAQEKPKPTEPGSVGRQLAEEALQIEGLIESDGVKEFVGQGAKLPAIEPFEVEYKGQSKLIDESLFYVDRFGSPLSYARALDLAAKHGLDKIAGKRVLDFGYGSIGQLQMLALCGADVTGVDVAPLLPLMYAKHSGTYDAGKVTLVDGQFPGDKSVAEKIGSGIDLVISKNVLKRGYIHPARDAKPEQLINLGVDDATFLGEIHNRLNPQGLFVIYNICPAQASDDKPYIPWADGQSPFSRQQFEDAGFEVLEFDTDDTPFAREMAKRLGWSESMDLETDLFGWYTVVRKPELP